MFGSLATIMSKNLARDCVFNLIQEATVSSSESCCNNHPSAALALRRRSKEQLRSEVVRLKKLFSAYFYSLIILTVQHLIIICSRSRYNEAQRVVPFSLTPGEKKKRKKFWRFFFLLSFNVEE